MTFDTDYIKFAEIDYKMADRFNDANHQFRYNISKVVDNLIYQPLSQMLKSIQQVFQTA
jgi:hypothetical protein